MILEPINNLRKENDRYINNYKKNNFINNDRYINSYKKNNDLNNDRYINNYKKNNDINDDISISKYKEFKDKSTNFFKKDNSEINLVKEENEIHNKNLIKEDEKKRDYRKYFEKDIKNSQNTKRFDFKTYFFISLIFLFGIIAGSIFFRLTINNEDNRSAIIEKIELIENENEIENIEIVKEIFFKSLKIFLICWIVGISVIGAPILLFICFYKGFSLAFTVSAIIIKYGFYQGNILALKNLYLYNLFMILAIFIMTASSIKVAINILKNQRDVKLELIRHSILSVFCCFLLIISGFLEIYFI